MDSLNNRSVSMARLLFFVLAGAFCIAACFPLRSNFSESTWADLTFAIAFQDHSSGIYYDRQFDWPTGEGIWIDVPVWVVDVGLFVMATVAFGFYAKDKLQNQKKVCPGCFRHRRDGDSVSWSME